MVDVETYPGVRGQLAHLGELLRQRWFLAVILWALLATQVTALLSVRDPVAVLSDALLDTLHLEFTAPVLEWLDLVVASLSSGGLVSSTIVVLLWLLSVASVYWFWADGREVKDLVEVDMAPINVMLRFTLLTTCASLVGQPAALWAVLVVVIGAYGVGAMTTALRHQRIAAFFAASAIMSVSVFAALFCPAVIAGARLYLAVKNQPAH